MAHELLLRGGDVVTVDDSAGDLHGGDILVRDDQIVVADGSRVTLNTDTTDDVNLKKGRREVRLMHGGALFEVAHDPARPFVVRAGKVTGVIAANDPASFVEFLSSIPAVEIRMGEYGAHIVAMCNPSALKRVPQCEAAT